MPQFAPGERKTATAPIVAKPAGMNCEAELFLGPNEVTKVASSGRVPFVSTGAAKNVSLPITMPTAQGTYHGYIDVFAGGLRFLAYKTTEDVSITPAYKVSVSFRREKVCEEGYMEGDTWVCTRYSPDEREGFITVINEGALGRFTTIVEGWFYLSGERGGYIFAAPKQWADNFEMGQTRVYRFTYMVPITGMPIDSRFFIKVYDPDGKIIADKVFITPL